MQANLPHMYADANAGATLAPAVQSFLASLPQTSYWHNPSSAHIEGQRSRNLLETAREEIANCFGLDANRLVFTSGGSESVATAFWSISGTAQAATEIRISPTDHPIARSTATMLSDKGLVVLQNLKPDRYGLPDGNFPPQRTGLLHLQAAHSELGSVLSRSTLENARKSAPMLHIDACQALGKLPLQDYFEYADFVSFSGHKIGAPAGTGLLYIREGLEDLQALLPGEQEWKRRGGTENLLGALLFAEAVKSRLQPKIQTQQFAEWRKILALFEHTLRTEIPDLDLLSPPLDQRLPQTSFFRIPGLRSHNVVMALDRKKICISSGTACRSGLVGPNETALALGYTRQQATETIRVSFDWDIQESQALQIAATLIDLAKKRN